MFRVAKELGLPVAECLQRLSHREYIAWMHWFELDFNMPGKVEHYLMQVAHEIWKKDRTEYGAATLNDFKLVVTKPEADPRTPEEIFKQKVEASKAAWMALAAPSKKNKKGKPNGNRQSNRPSNWR